MDLPPQESGTIGLGCAPLDVATTYSRQPLSIRVSARERRAIEAAAAAAPCPTSVFVRCAALRAAGQPIGPLRARRDALSLETARAVGTLGRIASSANQLAKAANCGRLPAGDRDYALDRLLCELTTLRALLLKLETEG